MRTGNGKDREDTRHHAEVFKFHCKKSLAPKLMKIKEDLMEILNDHKSSVIEMIEEENDPNLTEEIEAMHDRMITEINELLGSSYD